MQKWDQHWTPQSVPISTVTGDGWTLRGEVYRPAGAYGPVAVLGHAMWVNRRTLDRPGGTGLASTLVQEGLPVMTFDLRGHGQSRPSARQGGSYRYDDIVRHDIPAMVRAARLRFPGRPVVLVGHSLAGHAGLLAAGLVPGRVSPDAACATHSTGGTEAPDAIVALAANLWCSRWEPSRLRRWLKGGVMLAWAASSAPAGRFEAPALGLGTDAEPWPYVRQLVRMYLTGRLQSDDGRDDYLEALRRVTLPVLSVASEGDRWMAPPAEVERLLAALPRAKITRRVLTRTEVSPPPGHMGLVLSRSCTPVWREIARWIQQRDAATCGRSREL